MRFHILLASLTALTLAACSSAPKTPLTATADLQPTSGSSVKGQATFKEQKDGFILITARVEGLTPNSTHGFHIHEKGSCQDNGNAAGGHFNPLGVPHGKHNGAAPHHVGDLPSLQADSNGIATIHLLTPNLTVAPGKQSVESKALIVHAKPDDYITQPSGNAGDRVACAVIAVQ